MSMLSEKTPAGTRNTWHLKTTKG